MDEQRPPGADEPDPAPVQNPLDLGATSASSDGIPSSPDAPPETTARRPRGAVVGAWLTVQYLRAQDRIADQREKISDQQVEIEKQKELIDEKESFGAAMTGLLGTAARFDGVLTASIVPWDEYQLLAERAWRDRWD